jgi:hypothetical protein
LCSWSIREDWATLAGLARIRMLENLSCGAKIYARLMTCNIKPPICKFDFLVVLLYVLDNFNQGARSFYKMVLEKLNYGDEINARHMTCDIKPPMYKFDFFRSLFIGT